MTLEKFIRIQKNKTLIKYSLFIIFLLIFFLQINLSFRDFIDGFIRLSYILKGMAKIDFSDYNLIFFKIFETFIIAFVSSLLGVVFATLFSPFLSGYVIKNKFPFIWRKNVLSQT